MLLPRTGFTAGCKAPEESYDCRLGRWREREDLSTQTITPTLYYEYETRFIRQKLERERMRMLPRVVVPVVVNGRPSCDSNPNLPGKMRPIVQVRRPRR